MQKPKFRIPLRYIFLDTLGSMMAGLGIYGLIAGEVPSASAWGLIIFGILLMLPMVVYIVRNAGKLQSADE